MTDCEHDTITITTDISVEKEVCPICDDVRVYTFDERETVTESEDSGEVQVETLDEENQ